MATTTSSPAEQGAANIANDVRSAKDAIERGDWLDAGLSITNVAMDVINIAGDPLGAAASAGFGWIIEHISFLREPFDALLGDANSIMGSANGWMKTSQQITATAERYREAARAETCNWHGAAADGYRRASATQAQGLDALAQVSQGIGQAIQQAGQLLAEVRKTVLDFINKCVQKVIQIIIQALAEAWLSFGASIAKGIVQSVAEAVQTAQKIIGKIQKFVSSLQKIMQTIQKIVNLAKAVKQLLQTIGGRANNTQGASTRQTAPINTTGIDAAANARYSHDAGPAAADYRKPAHEDYRYNQYQPGTATTAPNYAHGSVPTPSTYRPPTGGGAGQPTYTHGAVPTPSTYRPPTGGGAGQPTYSHGAVPAPSTYRPPTGGQAGMPVYPGTGVPGPISHVEPPVGGYGPSGPPPDAGAPASRVDRARWIGSAVEILINHGVDPSRINAEQIAQIVDRNSGGNPHAMNLQDPSAAEGYPPKGLMQITDPVFQQHQVQGYDNIWSPVDNMLAGVMYFLAQWDSLMDAFAATAPSFGPQR
ncbi:transglycosylase SLT domain-containing protein [Actinokineospora sp. HUAS TT18]|uniref:transglycosylase SLT domain-containing protein n=1 Tax=Actinokineospora sp. HUAS TT18 TaxID=3447451 RepID=UPI003F5248CA